MADKSQDTYGTVIEALPQVPFRRIAHEEFKEMAAKAKTVIRTGETTPYANIILVAGVNFYIIRRNKHEGSVHSMVLAAG